MKKSQLTSRRLFVERLALGAAGLTALTSLKTPAHGAPLAVKLAADAEAWIAKGKGSHRIVYDASEQHDGLPFIWPWVFYVTNNETGVADNDMTAMVVIRHNAIPFAMQDQLWAKYNLGKAFNLKDKNGKFLTRNPYYAPQEGDFPNPAIEGIQKMQSRGAMFCVCNMALKVYSGIVASEAKLDAKEVYNDWVNGIHKDIQIVPSGVWAIGRAQENRFGYCYAGG